VIRDETISAFTYSFPVDSLIQQYKYQQRLPLLNTLSWAVADALAQQSGTRTNIDGLVPVPLHRKKLQQRGFNQCHWLAKRLSNCLEIPLLADLCERHVHAPAQSQQSGTARRSNMDRAFRLTRGLSTQTKHLAIVDDVITTGATVEAIAAQLKRAGASTVSVWTIATAFG
jgi:ComF family protein